MVLIESSQRILTHNWCLIVSISETKTSISCNCTSTGQAGNMALWLNGRWFGRCNQSCDIWRRLADCGSSLPVHIKTAGDLWLVIFFFCQLRSLYSYMFHSCEWTLLYCSCTFFTLVQENVFIARFIIPLKCNTSWF